MSDFQAVADRVEIEALRGEFTDAAMMRDRARLASLFTPDGALRMVRYLDTTALAGSAPGATGTRADPGNTSAPRPAQEAS
jgi:hypothetical protein